MPAPHRTPIKVRFNELDPYGHVNHAQYVSYFEHGRTEALESIGLGLHEMRDKGIQVVVTEITVTYKVPAVAGDELVVLTSVAETRRARTVWWQRILRGEELCARLVVKAGVTNNEGRPIKPPGWLFESMAPLLVDPEPDADPGE